MRRTVGWVCCWARRCGTLCMGRRWSLSLRLRIVCRRCVGRLGLGAARTRSWLRLSTLLSRVQSRSRMWNRLPSFPRRQMRIPRPWS
eukprot:COSAG04_NODE_2250_length_4446_cov_52.316310_4_plen_87_part_00